jgi:hypothetical protein
MEPLDFLAAVLPSPGHGYYCAAELSSNKKQHVFGESLDEFTPYIEQWVANEQDVYFALATFADKGKRTADNAEYLRSLFIDMDGYESIQVALDALGAFLSDTGLSDLGNPWIVASGGGLHCYWSFDTPVEVSTWKPVAEGLKRLCKQRDLAIDNTVTADAARVLRIPGTKNFKKKYDTPRPVEVLQRGGPVSFDALAGRIEELLGASAPLPPPSSLVLPGKRPIKDSQAGVQILANSIVRFKQIVERTESGDGCLQLQHYVANATDEGMEPLWRAWLSQAKYCADGQRAAIMLSELHPYPQDRMEQKLKEIKGPYPCIKFDSENPGVCEKCKHFGKITNPLALGRELVSDNTEKEIEITPADPEDPQAPAVKVIRPTPPHGYAYGANGGVYADRMVEEADGTKRKQQVMILPYDLFVVDILDKENDHTVHMVANRKDKAADILFAQRCVVSKDELLKALASQNVMAAYGTGNDKNLFEYVRACVQEASVNKKTIKIPGQYGWQDDGSFVYAGRVYAPDGQARTVPMPDLQNITRSTRSMGTLDGWRRFVQLMIKRELYDLLAMGSIGFGAPLMKFTNMACLTFHSGSTESGMGKSLALNLICSVWGHPLSYRTGKSTSPVTMQQRIGNLNSLPFCSDEITHKSRHDMEWFPGMVFDLSEGKGKEKSETHHNRERINLVSWATLAYFTSNTHMLDYMSGAREHTSQGELMRMLEWTPQQKLNWTDDEEETLRLLDTNHGIAGEQYVRWLVQNPEIAKKVTQDTVRHLKAEWQMRGDERYWAAGCGAIVAGAILASSKYAGIIDLPVKEIIASLKKLIDKARKVVRSGKRTAEDVLNSFTREYYGQFVVVKQSNGSFMAELGNGSTIDQSITRSKVMGRVEHEIDKPGFVEYFIEEQVLKSHCVSMSFGYEDFKNQLLNTLGYTVRFIRKDMMAKTRGPQMRVKAISISRTLADDTEGKPVPVGET